MLAHAEPSDTMLGDVRGYVSLERPWCVAKQLLQCCGWLFGVTLFSCYGVLGCIDDNFITYNANFKNDHIKIIHT